MLGVRLSTLFILCLAVSFGMTTKNCCSATAVTGNPANEKVQAGEKKDTDSKKPDTTMNRRRGKRPERWGLVLNYKTGEDLYNEWANLKAIIIAPEAKKDGGIEYASFRVFRDLSIKPPQCKSETREELNKINRVWFIEKNADPLQKLSQYLRLESAPPFIAFFIPRELEEELLKKELAFRGKTEEEMSGWFTTFEVKPNGDKFDVRVLSQIEEAPKK